MVRRCCIITCRNGRSDCDEKKVSLFKVPSEQTLFEKWAQVIGETGSELYKSSSICERHFREDEIKRQALLKDSSGNVIFQRPLTKFSLTKEAIPSIFEKDPVNTNLAKTRRKRRSVIPDYPDNLNNTVCLNVLGSFTIGSDGNININYSNLLDTISDNNYNILQFNVSQPEVVPMNDKDQERNCENNAKDINGALDTNVYVNGHENGLSNGFDNTNIAGNGQEKSGNNVDAAERAKSVISAYVKPPQNGNVHDAENINVNQAFDSIGASVIDKEQIVPRIPNQFANINEMSLEAPNQVTIIIPEEEIIILNESNKTTRKKKTQQKNDQPKAGTLHYPLPESRVQMEIRTFDLIFHNSHKIKLPNPFWGYHKNSIDKDIIIFSKAKWFKSDILIPPVYEKQVVFHESDNMKIYINNKFSPLEVRRPKDMGELEQILKSVDEIVVCTGGPNIDECDSASCAQKDYAVRRWRHKLCPIIVEPGETICKFCVTINQVLRYPKKKRLRFGRRSAPVQAEES